MGNVFKSLYHYFSVVNIDITFFYGQRSACTL